MLSAFLDHAEPVLSVAWDPDGKRIYSAGHDKKVRIWNVLDPGKPAEISGFEADPFKLEVGFDNLFSACADGIVREHSLKSHELERAYPRTPDWIFCIAVRRSAGSPVWSAA